MAFGTHWEWRGFGAVNSKFAEQFSSLNTSVSSSKVVDTYIWAPGLENNIKIRKGYQSGLKFKRPLEYENNYELWTEREDELFDFPLSEKDQRSVRKFLNATKLDRLSSFPKGIETIDDTLSWFSEAGCDLIEVKKDRETKVWHHSGESVMVEWACLSDPQFITSISLESGPVNFSDNESKSSALSLISSALTHLGIDKLPLRPMNYLEALTKWANSNKI